MILNLNTKYIGKQIEFYETIRSTQDRAKEILLEENIKDNGKIVVANIQTNGRGTNSRTWYTDGENIAITIILYPQNRNISEFKDFTINIAECMKKAIQKTYDINLEIKKPNDLILNGKKIGGILTESTLLKETVKTLLVGVGFNVQKSVFEEEIKDLATSLKKEYKNIEFDRDIIVAKFLEEFENMYNNI